MTHSEKHISIPFQIEWSMMVVTVFLSVLNQIEFHLAFGYQFERMCEFRIVVL